MKENDLMVSELVKINSLAARVFLISQLQTFGSGEALPEKNTLLSHRVRECFAFKNSVPSPLT